MNFSVRSTAKTIDEVKYKVVRYRCCADNITDSNTGFIRIHSLMQHPVNTDFDPEILILIRLLRLKERERNCKGVNAGVIVLESKGSCRARFDRMMLLHGLTFGRLNTIPVKVGVMGHSHRVVYHRHRRGMSACCI